MGQTWQLATNFALFRRSTFDVPAFFKSLNSAVRLTSPKLAGSHQIVRISKFDLHSPLPLLYSIRCAYSFLFCHPEEHIASGSGSGAPLPAQLKKMCGPEWKSKLLGRLLEEGQEAGSPRILLVAASAKRCNDLLK